METRGKGWIPSSERMPGPFVTPAKECHPPEYVFPIRGVFSPNVCIGDGDPYVGQDEMSTLARRISRLEPNDLGEFQRFAGRVMNLPVVLLFTS
jgi:hypothetical protein